MAMHDGWTEAQRAQATRGCTVVVELGEGRDVVRVRGEIVASEIDGDGLLLTVHVVDDVGTAALHSVDETCADAATLLPPTLATLNRLAVESFGEGASVKVKDSWTAGGVGTMPAFVTVTVPGKGFRTAEFVAHDVGDAARECARWLAARGR